MWEEGVLLLGHIILSIKLSDFISFTLPSRLSHESPKLSMHMLLGHIQTKAKKK